MPFQLHPQLVNDTFVAGDFQMCRLLLMNDRQYPWFILVPRRENLRELYELGELDRQQVDRESATLAKAMMEAFGGEKMNIASLGNIVPQLHIHHIVRRANDPAWPAPVWGRHPAQPYTPMQKEERIQALKPFLSRGFR